MTSKNDEEGIFSWYNALAPLRVDIVGDFAGKELFAIHGEALLVHCISEAKILGKDGFQILHAVHAVESFLSKLQRRGCRFHIFWLKVHDDSYSFPVSDTVTAGFFRLTREIVIKHLRHNLVAANGMVFEFDSLSSAVFQHYIRGNAVRFFLCLDGFAFDEGPTPFAVGHLAIIHQLGCKGYNVAMLNNFEFNSSKALAYMLPPSAGITALNIVEPEPAAKKRVLSLAALEQEANIPGECCVLHGKLLSAKDTVSLTALCNVLLYDHTEEMKQCAVAYILHLAELRRCSLASRPCPAVVLNVEQAESFEKFLVCFLDFCVAGIGSLSGQNEWDLVDLLDIRILRQIWKTFTALSPPSSVVEESIKTAHKIYLLTSIDISKHVPSSSQILPLYYPNSHDAQDDASIMVFHHPILDKYLASIHVSGTAIDPDGTSSIFRELSHWHNAKKAVDPKSVARPVGFFARRRNQRLMAETKAYAKSLTSTGGREMDAEIIVTGIKARGGAKNSSHEVNKSNGRGDAQLTQLNRKTRVKSGREMAQKEAQRIQKEKVYNKTKDVLAFWDRRCNEFQGEPILHQRLAKAVAYLDGLSPDAENIVGAEVNLYICHTLVTTILKGSQENTKFEAPLLAKIWLTVQEATKLPLSISSHRELEMFTCAFNLSTPIRTDNLPRRSLPFPTIALDGIEFPTDTFEFQLQHCGPFLERSFDAAPDFRVPFTPDAWQRRVLDAIDAKKSLFVVAPTSTGKTFISFYAMKQVLQDSDDGVLVYVAPTKALVNQIAAEVQARFSKSYGKDAKSVWGIHTRDYRINNPTGCQVLVTVPHILQIMLLSPSNANGVNPWAARVKRIVFDEVHCIGQADDGVIWEQLLLMSPCPIIALSATVGNPHEFMQWLKGTERVKGRELEMIVHTSRYSDLRKFMFSPPKCEFTFRGLLPVEGFITPGLDDVDGGPFKFIHPIASLVNRHRGTIEDLTLEPRDCLTLWRSMLRHQNDKYPVDNTLSPKSFFKSTITRPDVFAWEGALKEVLQSWIQDPSSPFSDVQDDLSMQICDASKKQRSQHHAYKAAGFEMKFPISDKKQHLVTIALPLLTDLHARGGLPGILFNYDRDACEKTAVHVLSQLEAAEKEWKITNADWKRKLAEYAEWKKGAAAKPKMAAKNRSAKQRGHDSEEMSKLDIIKDNTVEANKWESFDPDAPLGMFSFADGKRIPSSELQSLMERLRHSNVKPDFIKALARGIAVHHAGMNRQYRQIVEMLFRKRFIRVVVATGTLALGINMPCKTVVFLGDSVFLTALNYHQASGRAGRRGFDLLGNVIFAGMPHDRALKIMSSRLPDLAGHFPLSTTLVLRLMSLLHHTRNSEYAIEAMASLVSQSRLYLGGPSDQMAIQHHLRFSIEYLRRQQLLNSVGAPLNFAGLVGHLYFTENAVFAFHALLKEGYFHSVCEAIDRNPESVLLKLVLVLSHLFCRIPMGVRNLDDVRSPSVISLPPLPIDAATILQGHNQETLDIFALYVSTFIDQHLSDIPDERLPFTGYEIKSPQQNADSHMISHLAPTKLRSPFAALSELTDSFYTIQELCTTVRDGVFLEEAAVPYIKIFPADTDGKPWNAYIYDFFKHGDLKALVRDNRIKRGDVWFHLKDFSLIIATIVTSLENFLSLRADGDDGMMDLLESEDRVYDDDVDDDEDDHMSSDVTMKPEARAIKSKINKKKEKAELESWEDAVSDEDDKSSSDHESLDDGQWEDDGNGNLKQVLKAFKLLRDEFDEKFRKVWA